MPDLSLTQNPFPYLVDGLLPEHEISILSGASGAGKSTFAAQLLAAIDAGEAAFFGQAISYPIRIGLVVADRSQRSYHELAVRVGLDTTRIQMRSLVDDRTINLGRLEGDSLSLLFDIIHSFDAPHLVVVDPFVTFLGVDTNAYAKVAPRLIKVNRFCMDAHITLLGTHHATKARTDYTFKRPQDRVSGTSALLGFTSTQLFLAAPDELGKPWAEFVCVPHNRPPRTIRLGRDTVGRFINWTDDLASGALADVVVKLLAKSGAVDKAKLRVDSRIDPATLDTLLDHMVAADVIRLGTKGEFRLAEVAGKA